MDFDMYQYFFRKEDIDNCKMIYVLYFYKLITSRYTYYCAIIRVEAINTIGAYFIKQVALQI